MPGTVTRRFRVHNAEQFHEALIAKAMEKLYRKDVEGLQVAEYWRKVYKDFVVGAKKYANTNCRGKFRDRNCFGTS